MSLPANRPGRIELLPYEPRSMHPVHVEGRNPDGSRWAIELVMVPMYSTRAMFEFPHEDSEQAKKNLQAWIDHLGPALYNPIEWTIAYDLKPREKRTLTVPLAERHPLIWHIRGAHRLRALEALDFNFVYVLLQFGVINVPLREYDSELRKNDMLPLLNEAYIVPCDNCGEQAKWTKSFDCTEQGEYLCEHCSHEGKKPPIYPEPI